MDIILQAQGVCKAYDGRTVLRGVDLAIPRGQSVALMGHNGSGKTTLLRMLAGLVRASSGSIERSGALRFGYVPEHFPKGPLSAAEYVRHMGRIEGLDRQTVDARSQALFADFFMDSMTNIPMKHLSKGTLQKVGVVQALVAGHDVLLLDEPLNGQDAASQQVFIRKVNDLRAQGYTVILSCHEPYLVRQISDVVYEIREGKLVRAQLPEVDASARAVLLFDGTLPEEGLRGLPEGCLLEPLEGGLRLTVPQAETNALILRMLQEGWRLRGMYDEDDA